MNKTNHRTPMKHHIWVYALATLFFGVVITLFFALLYPHHLHFQEQYQLFMFNKGYFFDVLSMPGGFADIIGRFITQFFLYAWVGASFIALIMVGIQMLTYRLLRTTQSEILTYVISFIPSILCCCFLCDENALMAAPIALLTILGIVILIQHINSKKKRIIVLLLSIPIVYMLAGPFVIPNALILIIEELRIHKEAFSRGHIIICAISLLFASSMPMIWHHLVHCSLTQLYMGQHYYRILNEFPIWAWLSMGIVPLLMLLPERFRHWLPRYSVAAFLISWIILMLIGGFAVNKLRSQQKEDTMAYDFMARHEMWNRIIQKAQDNAPKNQISVVALNLALSERGLLTDCMFEYPQNGIVGLLPNFESDYVSPLATAEVLYRLGLINTAQRFVFEAQEAIPDFQKSARCYKRLAETNLINGEYKVARKYLIALQHTLFYNSWATETLKLIEDDKTVNAHPIYGNLRKLRSNQDYFFGGNALYQILVKQLQANPNNRIAFEYLEASCMLAKDLEKVSQYYSLSEPLQYKTMPSAIQQAMLLYWSQNHKIAEQIPEYFLPNLIQGFKNFHSALQLNNGNASLMQKSFGKTYWSYYYFHQ